MALSISYIVQAGSFHYRNKSQTRLCISGNLEISVAEMSRILHSVLCWYNPCCRHLVPLCAGSPLGSSTPTHSHYMLAEMSQQAVCECILLGGGSCGPLTIDIWTENYLIISVTDDILRIYPYTDLEDQNCQTVTIQSADVGVQSAMTSTLD